MERLLDMQISYLFGGGRWVQLPTGEWVYVDDDEPAPDAESIL